MLEPLWWTPGLFLYTPLFIITWSSSSQLTKLLPGRARRIGCIEPSMSKPTNGCVCQGHSFLYARICNYALCFRPTGICVWIVPHVCWTCWTWFELIYVWTIRFIHGACLFELFVLYLMLGAPCECYKCSSMEHIQTNIIVWQNNGQASATVNC